MATAIAREAKRFGRYTLLGHIADGGMASVYLAQLRGDHRFAKWVALKVVHAKHAGDERFEKMFLTEARIVARIDHPNVGQVFDCGTVDGTCYLAMEYLSGQTLQKVFTEARAHGITFPLPIAARIVANIAAALHAAHELRDDAGQPIGVVHRDVSPHNIFVLYNGGTKLMDFGIASSLDRYEEEKTGFDELKGKLSYMSPEQMCRQPIDRRSDIFSLGIVLWEITCGQRLFKRNSEGETAIAILSEPIPSPSSVTEGYPPALERIVMRALERDVAKRYATAADMAADLEEYIAATGCPTGVPQVEAFMQSVFPTAIEEHSTTLRKAASLLKAVDAEAQSKQAAEAEIEVTIGTERPPPMAAPARRRGWLPWAAAAAVVVAASLGALTWMDATTGVQTTARAEGAPGVASEPPASAMAREPEIAAEAAPPAEAELAAAPPRAVAASTPAVAAAEPGASEREVDADPAPARSRRRTPAARPARAEGASNEPSPAESSPTASSSAGLGPLRPMTEFE